ncbi:MAG TPA: hypothetical protein VIN56_07970 [Candidatus Dormibacteraeota bacterium]
MASVLTTNIPDPQEVYRRRQLRNLDAILADLELMNLRESPGLPRSLAVRLRRAGVVHRDAAPVSEIIDLVFRAQEAYLQPLPVVPTRRRSAA